MNSQSIEQKHGMKFIIIGCLTVLLLGFNFLLSSYQLDKVDSTSVITVSPKEPTLAVIHMGTHKTGSTSIQEFSKRAAKYLESDGYHMLGFQDHQNLDIEFTACFWENQVLHGKPCDSQLLLRGLEIANRNENIFVSAEPLWMLSPQALKKLDAYFSRWDEVVIIIYYRRLYDYLGSMYNQMVKGSFQNNLEFVNGMDFLESSIIRKLRNNYVIEFVTSLNKIFRDVRVENYHNHPDIVESFFCDVLPNAKNTCAEYLNEGKQERDNSAISLCYIELVLAAKAVGLIDIHNYLKYEQLVEAVRYHQEHNRNMTCNDFKKKCLPSEILKEVWEASLKNEAALFPGQVSENEMRAEFAKAAHSTLCVTDVDEILKEEEWKSFFQSYKQSPNL